MANSTARVVVAMPCTDIVRARTANAIGLMIIEAKGEVYDFLLQQSCEIASARTQLVRRAIEKGGTHILFIDSDICPIGVIQEEEGKETKIIDANVIGRMLSHDKPIVATEYNMRKFPVTPTYLPLDKRDEKGLYKASHAGTGCMLINLAIFQDPKFGVDDDGKVTPWFNFGRDSNGKLVYGEDAWFCHTARDSGYDTWIDPLIKVTHVGEYQF